MAWAAAASIAASLIASKLGGGSGGGSGGGGGFGGGLQLPGFSGGTRQEVSQTATSSTSVQASPVVAVNVGAGDASPSGGGTSSATTPVTSNPLFGGYTYPSGYSAPVYSPAPANANDISSASAGLGGLFKDPLMIVLIAGAAFLIFSAKKGK